jgi:hypothetical protein
VCVARFRTKMFWVTFLVMVCNIISQFANATLRQGEPGDILAEKAILWITSRGAWTNFMDALTAVSSPVKPGYRLR